MGGGQGLCLWFCHFIGGARLVPSDGPRTENPRSPDVGRPPARCLFVLVRRWRLSGRRSGRQLLRRPFCSAPGQRKQRRPSVKRQPNIPPLPKGEGRGEGERSVRSPIRFLRVSLPSPEPAPFFTAAARRCRFPRGRQGGLSPGARRLPRPARSAPRHPYPHDPAAAGAGRWR